MQPADRAPGARSRGVRHGAARSFCARQARRGARFARLARTSSPSSGAASDWLQPCFAHPARRLHMLFPAIGLTTAVWLLMAPLLGLETGARAGMGIAVGLAVAVLLPLGYLDRRANVATAALGIFMGFANFFLPASTLALRELRDLRGSADRRGAARVACRRRRQGRRAGARPGGRARHAEDCRRGRLASPRDLHVRVDEDLHLAPRKRGEVAGRRSAGEGNGAATGRGPLSLTLSPLRGARAISCRGQVACFSGRIDEDLHLAPRKRGEVAGRRPAGEGNGAAMERQVRGCERNTPRRWRGRHFGLS